MKNMEKWLRFFSLTIGFFGVGVIVYFTVCPNLFSQKVFSLNVAGGKIWVWLGASYLIFTTWAFFIKDIPVSWIKYVLMGTVMMSVWFIFFVFKLRSLEMSLEMINFSVSFFLISVINIAIVIPLLFLLGLNVFKVWDELSRDNYRGLKFLISNALKYFYFAATVFIGIVAFSLSIFVVWFVFFSDKMIISVNLFIAYILVMDIILYFITFWFFLKKENKEYEIRNMKKINKSCDMLLNTRA